MDFITKNAGETQLLSGKILKELMAQRRRVASEASFTRGALVLALQGELGAGKTTFIQGLAQALGIKEKILSPTFVIMKHFKIAASDWRPSTSLGVKFKNFYHMDCYRLEGGKDLEAFNFKEILKNKNNLVVIEWAERVKDILPEDTIWLEFEHGGEDIRKILMTNDK
ncbi:MAG: tRNA (adenosine(37)-N6)-threonylcarbamoyltransferase complex ATPase subunit type 1 TsaE [Candidatus Portnoybacteria bacterium]|nr:tRNA (adenosine(37)-N6)-threonylcarbamoyltransferase complex ATPase subunit type 1 TsaE [Candidatus Portnoybacteria bacterium]MDD4982691.1 tRNA (adenosine(37)-N6)-threonylcarbamoyltransferase complex ATPase subunit type 1 TsaE [Candidatus Portnoybacteria bacterium]